MLIYFSFLFAKSQIILQFQKAWMDIPLCGQLMQTPSLYKCFSNILQGERVVRDLSFLPCSRMSIAISVMNLIQKSHFDQNSLSFDLSHSFAHLVCSYYHQSVQAHASLLLYQFLTLTSTLGSLYPSEPSTYIPK